MSRTKANKLALATAVVAANVALIGAAPTLAQTLAQPLINERKLVREQQHLRVLLPRREELWRGARAVELARASQVVSSVLMTGAHRN